MGLPIFDPSKTLFQRLDTVDAELRRCRARLNALDASTIPEAEKAIQRQQLSLEIATCGDEQREIAVQHEIRRLQHEASKDNRYSPTGPR